jgi:hypothetical protein
MRNLQEIEKALSILDEKLKNVQGSKTEVYTRIVGYHRDVTNWNKGKKEEYKDRVTFKVNSDDLKKRMKSETGTLKEKKEQEKLEEIKADNISFYKFFYSQVCRNCPPVKNYMKNVSIPGEYVDVTSDLGLNSARQYNILSTPTVVLFDKNEHVVKTASSVEDLKKLFP